MAVFADEISPHLPPHAAQRAEERILQAAPHYLWFWTEGRKKTGYCTACGESGIPGGAAAPMKLFQEADRALRQEREDLGLSASLPRDMIDKLGTRKIPSELRADWKHLHYGACPRCGAVVQYRSEALRRAHMIDTVILSQYARSSCDPDTIVMMLWQGALLWCRWNPYTEKSPEMDLRLREVCLMKKGTAGIRYTTPARWTADVPSGSDRACNFRVVCGWERKKECISGFWPAEEAFPFEKSRVTGAADLLSVNIAFAGTHVAEIALKVRGESNLGGYYDQISLYNAILRYPCIEYLARMGCAPLAGKIVDRKAGHLLNLRGKNAQAVLKLDGNTLGWIKGKKIPLDTTLLSLLQLRTRMGLRLSCDALLAMQKDPSYGWDSDFIKGMAAELPRDKLEKALRYVCRRGIASWDYLDHLRLMRELNMDFNDDSMTMPRDFPEIHARLAARVEARLNADKDKKLRRRVGRLGAYWFSALGWTIRPMLSAEEVVREGTALRHCVGSYVERYAAGGTILLCLRADDALDTPLYTVEYSTAGKRVQVRGYKNGMQEGWHNGVRMADEEKLELFWRLFDAYRLDWKRAQDQKKQKGRAAA